MSEVRIWNGQVTVEDVLSVSGLHSKTLDFAMFNGYRLPTADQSLNEQYAAILRKCPGISRRDALILLGDDINADLAEFFNRKFPVVQKDTS